MKYLICLLLTILLIAETNAQIGDGPGVIENPEWPVIISPPPPILCPGPSGGFVDGVPGRCNPVSDLNCTNPCGPEPVDNSFEIYPDSGLRSQFPDHITCEQNYYHCQLSNFQLGQALGACTNPAVPPASPCAQINDGPGGALWKPISESYGTAVLLMPGSYEGIRVELVDSTGSVIARVIRDSCCANGGRQHYFFDRAGPDLPAIELRFSNGQCISVPNPAVRVD